MGYLNDLNLNDLKLIFAHLLTTQAQAFGLLSQGGALTARAAAIDARLKAFDASAASGLPLVEQLARADGTHDGYGRALWYFCAVLDALPDASDDLRAVAADLRATFIPSLSDLNLSYADEAARAQSRLPALEARRDALAAIPTQDGRTVADWVQAYLDAGVRLGDLLGDRAERNTATSQDGVQLRRDALAFLRTLHSAVQLDQALNPSLDPNIEGRLFDFARERAASRA